jgi:hypothetical protein
MAEPTETIIVTLAGSQQYEVREAAFVRINLADDGDVALTAVQVAGGNVQIDFSGATGVPTSAFTLQSSADVASGYAVESGANISQLSPGFFRATATLNGPIRFYRIQR